MPTVSKKVKSLTTKTAEARLAKMRLQVERLRLENRRLKGQVGNIDTFKREVIGCNAVVKQQILAVPFRLATILATISDPRELARVLTEALVEALNDLAYERELSQPEENMCPLCGREKQS